MKTNLNLNISVLAFALILVALGVLLMGWQQLSSVVRTSQGLSVDGVKSIVPD